MLTYKPPLMRIRKLPKIEKDDFCTYDWLNSPYIVKTHLRFTSPDTGYWIDIGNKDVNKFYKEYKKELGLDRVGFPLTDWQRNFFEYRIIFGYYNITAVTKVSKRLRDAVMAADETLPL